MAAHVFGVGFSIAGRAREIDSKEQLLAKRRSYSESIWNPSQTRSDVAAYHGITDRHLRRLSDEFGVGFDALPPVQTAMLPATLRHLMNMGFVSARSTGPLWLAGLKSSGPIPAALAGRNCVEPKESVRYLAPDLLSEIPDDKPDDKPDTKSIAPGTKNTAPGRYKS